MIHSPWIIHTREACDECVQYDAYYDTWSMNRPCKRGMRWMRARWRIPWRMEYEPSMQARHVMNACSMTHTMTHGVWTIHASEIWDNAFNVTHTMMHGLVNHAVWTTQLDMQYEHAHDAHARAWHATQSWCHAHAYNAHSRAAHLHGNAYMHTIHTKYGYDTHARYAHVYSAHPRVHTGCTSWYT